MKMIYWNVFLKGNLIDSVPFMDDMDEWHVKDSLINHDGYDPEIKVVRC
jgi:hypothetical protein